MGEQIPRLTTGSSPVYPRFISGTKNALSSWLLTGGPTPFCLCKPFSCKACPGMIAHQQNHSPNSPIQNANTSHAVEACRLHAGRRASLRVGRRAGLRVGRRAGCASEDAPGDAPGDAPFCAPGNAPVARRNARRETRRETRRSARRETRRLRVARRAGCASRDAPVCTPEDAPSAHRETRRLHAVCARGPVRSFSLEAGGASKLLAGGAGGWLTTPLLQAA